MYDILLVDNEVEILNGLKQGINWERALCYVKATARDGYEAINLITTQCFDIVVSDIRMPEMDGLKLAEWIHNNYPSIKIIMLTGFPDFEYAQQAINYRVVDFVLKPTNEEKLIDALEKAKRFIDEDNAQKNVYINLESETEKGQKLNRSLLFYDLIFNPGLSEPNLIHRIRELEVDLSKFYILRVGIYSDQNKLDYSTHITQIQEALPKFFVNCAIDYVLKADRVFYVILSGTEDMNPEPICNNLVEWVNNNVNFLVKIGISCQYNNLLDMNKAALEADNAHIFTEYSEVKTVLSSEQIPELSKEASQIIAREIKVLESAVEYQSRKYAEKSLNTLFNLIRTQHIPYSSVQKLCIIINNFCNGILINHNCSEAIFGITLILSDQLPTNDSIDAIEEQLHRNISYVLDCLGNYPADVDTIVYSVKTFIDQNYTTELSLDTLASKVNLSASYLSRLFKKQIGKNLSAYIQFVRIEQAKVLLYSTMLKTYEVAEAVGINDPVYFSKTFKKLTGIKPRDYRMKVHPID